MADRASIFQTVNVGVESTSGSAVVCAKKLTSMSIEPAIKTNVETFRPMGTKYATLTQQGKEWTEAKVSGLVTYTELVYALSSLLKPAVITTPSGGTTARQWLFEPSATLADAVKSLTVEQGSAERAHRFAYGLFNSLSLKFDRDKVELSGSMLGQAIEDGVTMNASPTAIALVPVMPKHVSIYLADTQAGLAGATALSRVVSCEWSLSDRFGMIWPLNAAKPSWDGHVEKEPKLAASLLMEADADGMGLLTQLRNGATKWLRIKCEGDTIESTIKYLLQIDQPIKITDPKDFTDSDGLFAIGWDGTGVFDSAWGKAISVTVVNNLSAL
jgi:hypothetical protein